MKEQVLAVQRMQDFIENHQSEEISLSDLARASLFSPWYAYRLFRDYLGLTPTEYIRKCRLTQAAKQLRSGKVKVIDAAYDAGFANVDTFTRAFYREFGLNPSDYMKYPIPLTFFIPYGAKYREAVLLPLAHHWGFWYNTLDGLIYGTFILAAKVMWHLIDFGQSFYMAAALNEQIRKRKREEIQKEGTNNG